MDNHNDPKQIAFLEGAWSAVLHHEVEPFRKSLLADFVSSDVMNRLPEHTTLHKVLAECHAQGAFQESYIKSFLGLRKHWTSLTPESRHTILQFIQKCGLERSAKLQMLEDDEAALTIRWDLADQLYASAREQAYKACQPLGLEMFQPRGLPRKNELRDMVRGGQTAVFALLKERINIDKTAVTMAVGYVTPVAKTKIKHNLSVAYVENLDTMRAALFHWSLHNLQAFSSLGIFTDAASAHALTGLEESVIREYIEHALKPYKEGYEKLCAAVDDMSSDPTIYDKARHFFQSGQKLH